MRFRKAVTALLSVFLPIILAGAAVARGGLEVEHGHTMSHSHRAGHWNMVFADVKNSSGTSEELTAVFTVRRGMTNIHYRHRFLVPSRSRRRLGFPAQFGENESYSLRLVDDSGRSFSEYEVLSALITRHRTPVLRVEGDDAVLPSLSPGDPAVWDSLAPGLGRAGNRSTDLERFPDHVIGLDSETAVMIGAVDHSQWIPSQVDALEKWVEGGGVLVLVPGKRSLEEGFGFFERLSPVVPYGSRRDRVFDIRSDRRSFTVELEEYVDVLEVQPVGGAETVLKSDGLPMLVGERRGLGKVYAFAFPGAVLDAFDSRESLLGGIVRSGSEFNPVKESRFHGRGPRHLDQVAGTEVPSRGLVFGVVGGFVVLSIIALVLLHFWGRGELAWVVILPAAVVVMVVAYRLSSSYREEVGFSLNEAAVLHGLSGSAEVTRNALVGLYSPRTLRADLEAPARLDAAITSDVTEAEEGRVTNRNVEVGEKFSVTGMRLAEGDFPRFHARSSFRMQGSVYAEVIPFEQGMSATARNESGMDLKGAMFVVNGYPFRVGDMADGEVKEVELTDRSVGPRWNFTTRAVLGPGAQARMDMVTDMFRPESGHLHLPWQDRLYFIAWAPEGKDFIVEELIAEGEAEPQTRSMALLCLRPVREQPRRGADVFLPGAFNSASYRRPGSRSLRSFGAIEAGMATSEIEMVFHLDELGRGINPEEGVLRLNLDARGSEFDLYGLDDGEQVSLSEDRIADEPRVLRIPDIGRFYNEKLNTVELGLAIISPPGSSDGPVSTPFRWRVSEAYLSVSGTAR